MPKVSKLCGFKNCKTVIHGRASQLNRLLGLHKHHAHGVPGMAQSSVYRRAKAAQEPVQTGVIHTNSEVTVARATLTEHLRLRKAALTMLLSAATHDLEAVERLSMNGASEVEVVVEPKQRKNRRGRA